MSISKIVWSWLYIVPLIPSVIVAIFALYHLLIDRVLRRALNNHVFITLLSDVLIVCLTDIVWYIYYFRNGTVLISTPAFCIAWIMVDSALYVSVSILTAWASIERHILIFYPNWFGSRKKCFFFHYIPLAVCLLYPATFYIVNLIIIPCDVPFNYHYTDCGRYSCISNISWLALWDSIGHYIMPVFTTVIFSVVLFVRVLYSRYRTRRRIDWRNYRKLTLQLLPISVLCIALQFPPMIMYAAYSAGLSWSTGSNYYYDASNFTYWVILFTPYACVVSLPDLRTKCRKVIFFWRRNRAVGPQPQVMARPNLRQMRAAVATVG